MTVTVDPSVILAVLLNERTRRAILNTTSGAELNSAASLPREVGNALSALCMRGRMSVEQATTATQAYLAIPVRLAEIDPGKALRLAGDKRICAYDAFILDGAIKYRTPLLTLDQRQKEVAAEIGISFVEIPS